MPKFIAEEIKEAKKPLLIAFANNKKVQELIFDELSEKLALLFVSTFPPVKDNKETYHIKPSETHLLPNLEEIADYAFVMFSEENEKEHINYLFRKIKKDKVKSLVMIPANDYKNFTDVLLEIKNEHYIIPALYGQILEDDTSLHEFLKIIRIGLSKGKIELKGNDLTPVFPISEKDFMTGIKQLLFSNKPRALYYLFYEEPQTLLSAVHMLAKIEPELTLDINHNKPIERFEERSVMDQHLSYKFQMKIHYLDHYLKGFTHAIDNLKLKSFEKKSKHTQKHGKSLNFKTPNFFRFTPSVSLALFSAFFLFLLINLIFGILGIFFLRSSIYAFENNDFKSAKENGVLAKNVMAVPLPTLSVMESAISYLPFMEGAYDTLHLVTSTADLTTTSSDLIEKMDKLGQGLTEEELDRIIQDSQYLYHSGSRILLKRDNRAISSLLTPETTKTLSLMPVTSTLLGYGSSKEYLLLFMNNAELRPTGGFIGSVGKLEVEKGRITDFSIQDVYDLDGQLTQHIKPHYIIRRNLQPHLYLRDSNFDLDFQRSASTSAKIYNLESGNTPDGVVALDFSLIKRILEITGPITLKEYDQTINSENSMEFLQGTIEENFFPGSTQKKEVLNDLFTNIMLEIEKKPEHLVSIGLALPKLLEEKHILLSYQDKKIQSLLSGIGFGGQIPTIEKENSSYIYDILGFNEANIGVNKVNKDISRSISYEADLTSRLSNAKLTLRNRNEEKDYVAYVRLIAPRNSIFRRLEINGEEVETVDAIKDPTIFEAENFSPDENVYEVEKTQDYRKTIFGTVVTVENDEVMDIEFTYTNPELFLNDGKDEYHLNVIKQPGTNKTPSNFTVLFPKEFNAEGEEIVSFGDNSIEFESNLRTDTKLKAGFTKN